MYGFPHSVLNLIYVRKWKVEGYDYQWNANHVEMICDDFINVKEILKRCHWQQVLHSQQNILKLFSTRFILKKIKNLAVVGRIGHNLKLKVFEYDNIKSHVTLCLTVHWQPTVSFIGKKVVSRIKITSKVDAQHCYHNHNANWDLHPDQLMSRT